MALAFFTLWTIKKKKKPTQVHTRTHWEGIVEKIFLSRIKKEEAPICCEVLEKHKDFLFGCHKAFPLSPYICSSHSLSLSLSVRLSFSLSLSLPLSISLSLPPIISFSGFVQHLLFQHHYLFLIIFNFLLHPCHFFYLEISWASSN